MSEPFGKYQLIEKIAQGGMAEVFLASRKGAIGGFTRRLAIKRMFPHLVDQEEIITMFIDEARIAACLHHPNIVQIYDLGVEEESFFIAMEYVEGLDLRRLCELGVKKKDFIPRHLAVHIICEVAAGLHYAHNRTDENDRPMKIIHRDVSPQNVMISVDGAVKLCDFGIAKAESRLTHTQAGEFKGKFSYMSPEQFGHGTLDHRSDIFTLGIVLYEITVASRLFKARTEYETIRRITEGEVTPPSAIRPGFPRELERIIMKALSVEVADRFQSAEELHAELEEWLFSVRARAGTRQLAAYLDGLLEGPGRSKIDRSREAEQPGVGPVEEDLRETSEVDSTMESKVDATMESKVDSTMELSMTDADFLEIEDRSAVDVADLDESTMVDGSYSFPTESEPAQVADAVEIRRISPEEARQRRHTEEEVGSIDKTIVEGGPDETTIPMQGEEEPLDELVATGRQVTDRWNEEQEDSNDFLGAIPELQAGGEAFDFAPQRSEQRGAVPTGPLRPVPRAEEAGGGELLQFAVKHKRVLTIVGVAAVMVMGSMLMILVARAMWNAVNGETQEEVAQVQEEVVRGGELVGEKEVMFSLVSDPPGASVVVNGVLQGQTPLEVALVDERENEVWITRRHHRPIRLLVPAQGEDLERSVELERAAGTRSARVYFQSNPVGAEVFLNGESMGMTPLRMENVGADFETHIQMELEGHRPFIAFLDLRTSGDNRIQARLPEESEEMVRGNYRFIPRGSRVMLSGEFVDNTPFEKTHHRDEWLVMEAQGDRRQSQHHRFRLDQIGSLMVGLELEEEAQETGRVTIEVEPTAAVYVGARAFGASPLEEVELPSGEQIVILETIEGRRIRVALEVEAGAHRHYLVQLDGDDANVERQ